MRGLVFLAAALLALATSTALAQDADVIEEVDETAPYVDPAVDEITVTGTQSDVTNIQSESKAVSAFSM